MLRVQLYRPSQWDTRVGTNKSTYVASRALDKYIYINPRHIIYVEGIVEYSSKTRNRIRARGSRIYMTAGKTYEIVGHPDDFGAA